MKRTNSVLLGSVSGSTSYMCLMLQEVVGSSSVQKQPVSLGCPSAQCYWSTPLTAPPQGKDVYKSTPATVVGHYMAISLLRWSVYFYYDNVGHLVWFCPFKIIFSFFLSTVFVSVLSPSLLPPLSQCCFQQCLPVILFAFKVIILLTQSLEFWNYRPVPLLYPAIAEF